MGRRALAGRAPHYLRRKRTAIALSILGAATSAVGLLLVLNGSGHGGTEHNSMVAGGIAMAGGAVMAVSGATLAFVNRATNANSAERQALEDEIELLRERRRDLKRLRSKRNTSFGGVGLRVSW